MTVPVSPISRFRLKRAAMIERLIDSVIAEKGSATLLDVGGTRAYWESLGSIWRGKPIRITVTNIAGDTSSDEITVQRGDACAMPEFADGSFDIVHSNSVIEHVGHWREIARMAGEVRRLGRHYYLQTPNLYFPLEPHFKLPFLHWLPESARAQWLRRIDGQLPPGASYDDAMRRVQGINLLTARQMRELFPDGRLVRERFLGLSKSLIVIRDR